MDFDFDEIIERRGTNCSKYDSLGKLYGVTDPDAIPMWVADMDFKSPPAVQATLSNILKHGVYGYFGDDRAYKASIVSWMQARHGWEVTPGHILTTHGLVQAIGLCLQAFSKAREGVIVFSPVYHAFLRVIKANDRKLVESPLVIRDGVYHMDLDALETQLTGKERIVLISSPHNPGGRVWSADELKALAAFCVKHDLLLISDEVHAGLVYPGQTHSVMAMVAPEIEDRLITLTGASKAFNLAGEHTGQLIIPDKTMRDKVMKKIMAHSISPNRIGLMMTTAAFAYGGPWLDALVEYLDGNRRLFEETMADLPGVSVMPLQSTYLAWADFSGTGMETAEVLERLQVRAKVVPSHGSTFGEGGESWMRFNIGMRRALLREALDRIRVAFSDLQ